MSEDVTVFVCGLPRDHKHDDNGPVVYYFSDGFQTFDEKVGRSKRDGGWNTGASVTCSQCGMSWADITLWDGP